MAPTTNHVLRSFEGKVQKVPTELAPLKPTEVLIKITHSGLCHTDMFYITSGMALGHEGVGIVEQIGSEVTQFKVGDRAGGGYLRKSCGKCKYCLSGQEIWCYSRDIYGEASYNTGTFADYYVGDETYVYKIPDGMASADAAPLQCAGATVYSALTSTIKPGDRVGVIGIGGLGHLAIQFANKLGAAVVVFSTNPAKEAEARAFGANEFYDFGTPEKLSALKIKDPIDVLVLSGSKYPDFSVFLTKEILARTGTVVPLTASNIDMKLPSMRMLFDGYNVHSSLVSSPKVHKDMLDFAALHGIKPTTEEFAMNEEGWANASEKLLSGKIRYRAVLKH